MREHAAEYDAVIVNGIWGFNALGTWLALRRHREVPFFVFTHGMLDPWFKRTYPRKHLKKWLYWPWGLYPVLRDADAEGVADVIYWTGMITGDAKWGAFQAAEVFVLPSHQENFGIAVAESLSTGTPVLISHAVNISPEIAADGAGLAEDDTVDGTVRMLGGWLRMDDAARERMRAQRGRPSWRATRRKWARRICGS